MTDAAAQEHEQLEVDELQKLLDECERPEVRGVIERLCDVLGAHEFEATRELAAALLSVGVQLAVEHRQTRGGA